MVDADGRRTDGRRLDGYTISSHCEPNDSGELIIIKNEKKGYSYNLMLKNIPYHIMAELKNIPIMPAPPHTHLYRR